MDTNDGATNDTNQTEQTGSEPAEGAAPAEGTPSKPAAKPAEGGDTKPKTARDVVSEAFDKLKKDKDDAAKDPANQKGAREVKVATPDPAKQAAAAVPSQDENIDPLTGKPYEPIKPPQSMPAVLREGWKNLPRDFQKYYAQRELDMAQNLSKLGANNKFATAINQAVAPLEGHFKRFNLTNEQGITRILNEAHLLQAGSPQQRAQLIGTYIQQFRPDPNVLKAIISGQNPNVPLTVKQQPTVDQLVDQRLQQREQESLQKTNDGVIQAFMSDPANEFVNDVQDQMAAVITGKLVPTQGKTQQEILQAAYDFAVKNHPEIQAILAKRGQGAAAAPAAASAASAAAPVRAVRSAKPSPGAGKPSAVPGKKFKNAREAALAAWDTVKGNE